MGFTTDILSSVIEYLDPDDTKMVNETTFCDHISVMFEVAGLEQVKHFFLEYKQKKQEPEPFDIMQELNMSSDEETGNIRTQNRFLEQSLFKKNAHIKKLENRVSRIKKENHIQSK